jgi:hypothetical protein
MGNLALGQASHALREMASTTPGALTLSVVLALIFLGVVFAMR